MHWLRSGSGHPSEIKFHRTSYIYMWQIKYILSFNGQIYFAMSYHALLLPEYLVCLQLFIHKIWKILLKNCNAMTLEKQPHEVSFLFISPQRCLRGIWTDWSRNCKKKKKKACSHSKYFEHEQTDAVPDMLVKKVPVCCMVQCSVLNEGKRRSVSEELSLWVGEWSWNINIDMWRPYLMRTLEVRRRNLNWISYETQGHWRFRMAGSLWSVSRQTEEF